ncbi:MAG: hypothetical protein Tsb005_11380 [Gammaproteobacteria bacterium]
MLNNAQQNFKNYHKNPKNTLSATQLTHGISWANAPAVRRKDLAASDYFHNEYPVLKNMSPDLIKNV